jgi:hypothetical protein
MQTVLKQNGLAFNAKSRHKESAVRKIGIFGSLFGCWHRRLSRPITTDNETYQTCLECGARRKFDTGTFRSFGRFYYPPVARVGNY